MKLKFPIKGMKNKTYFPLLLFTILAIGVFLGTLLNIPIPENKLSSLHKNKLNKLINLINNEYVDAVNTDSIVDLTVNNILDKLDPHSVYIPKNEMTAVNQSMKGNFVGIGINFYMYNDTLTVIKSLANSPSEKAGLQPGDQILYANKTKLFGRKLPTDSLYNHLKGKEGSEVKLTVFRKNENKMLTVNVKRAVVAIKSVDIGLMINSNTGYIKINRFSETTYEEFCANLNKLKKLGAQTLIIDVRDNGGGYMEEAVAIADEFLKEKQLIVFTKNKNAQVDKIMATKNGRFETGQVVVLVNENSASASEILAGALQDNDRATIVGRRTFGKGLVQREVNFEDGSAVRLTIARYYTPTGRSIQKPYSKGKDAYFKEFDRRFLNGELYEKDSIKVNDSLKFKTPKGKIVYGGGGIVPDIFVPYELKQTQTAFNYWLESGVIDYFVFEEINAHRKDYLKVSYDQFILKNNDMYFNKLQKYLQKNHQILLPTKLKEKVNKHVLSEFIKQLYGDEKFYKLSLNEDQMIKVIFKEKYTNFN